MENYTFTTLNLTGQDFKGTLIPNKTLLSPGYWNGKLFSEEEIQKAYYNTDWKNYTVVSLIADHSDDDSDHLPLSVHDWLGYIENPRLEGGSLVGDLRLYDSNISKKLIDAKAKFGVSAKLQTETPSEDDEIRDFAFKNFSVVVNPACKDAFINLSQETEALDSIKSKLNKGDELSNREISVLSKAIEEVKEKNTKKEEETNTDVEKSKDNGPESSEEKSDSSKPELSSDNDKELKGGLDNNKKMTEEEKVKEDTESKETSSEDNKEQSEKLSDKEILSKAYEILGAKLDNKTEEKSETEKLSDEISSTLSKLSERLEALENSVKKLSEDEKSDKEDEESKESTEEESKEDSSEKLEESKEESDEEDKKDTESEKKEETEKLSENEDDRLFSLNQSNSISSGTKEMAAILKKQVLKR